MATLLREGTLSHELRDEDVLKKICISRNRGRASFALVSNGLAFSGGMFFIYFSMSFMYKVRVILVNKLLW